MPTMNRRELLRASAVTSGMGLLAACSGSGGNDPGPETRKTIRQTGSAKRPLPVPDEFGEAPMLAEQVRAGELPQVSERLPERPYVVPHNWLRPGKYGGSMRLIIRATDEPSNKEYMYGHSLLRWLNDCRDVGPGLAESWESNDDATEWTFRLRAGLKWSDGEQCTTEDILFWWEDLVLHDDHESSPPDELRSSSGKLAKVSTPNELTLVLRFDTPSPLTADRIANWVNGGNGSNGPGWILPKHYLKQFHPRYNDKAPKDWAAAGGAFDQNADFAANPDCPTMTGWRLVSARDGQNLTWERNPYYWCVDSDGQQLPYLDQIVMTAVNDPEVGKLQMQEGQIDYAHGPFVGVELNDVAEFRKAEERSRLRVLLWDSGAGGGATTMFNQDYREAKYRELFRDARFRRALSYAFNRSEVHKAVYFNSGERTTGTMSPKAIEYQAKPDGPKVYREWRDSYVRHDPGKANELLDELGLVDSDGDGNREFPDGSKLTLRIEYPATEIGSHVQTNQMLAKDWAAVGIETKLNPVPAEAYADRWSSGRIMLNTRWEIGDGPNHLVFPNFLVPIDPDRWAPLQGQFYAFRGTPDENAQANVDPYERTPPRMEAEPGGPVERLWELYDRTKAEPDEMRRNELVWQMVRVHIDEGPFMHGSVADYPRVILAHSDLRNVPDQKNLAQGGYVNPWIHPTPAVYDPETYFWANPDQHR